ncbi:MAG: phosphoribosylaminoimidazolesuccinocarboxamide synthase [Anaerovoracaceae bacterium]|nr:phosphoribosylaminoimidazolesuccinocarboxamide synthase [Anaerovoracaceae bacterium]
MAEYKKGEQIYEGKAKKVFRTDDPDYLIVEYKDSATAFDGQKKGTILGKGVVNNRMSNMLMDKMSKEAGIPSHFVEELNDRETVVKNVEILPLECIVRNISAGSFAKRYGVEEGIVFSEPSFETSYKNDDLHDPLMVEDHAIALGLSTREEYAKIREMALAVDKYLQKFFLGIGLKLVDFKLEFGRFHGEIILADEISPDTCRLWDVETNEKMDKDRFRRDLGNVEETYQEVFRRVSEACK